LITTKVISEKYQIEINGDDLRFLLGELSNAKYFHRDVIERRNGDMHDEELLIKHQADIKKIDLLIREMSPFGK